jgi:hypothetical protein
MRATKNGSAGRDSLFRLAAAENASGRTKEALIHKQIGIDKGYVPIHERVLLAKYLSHNDFEAQVDFALSQKYPEGGSAEQCQRWDR